MERCVVVHKFNSICFRVCLPLEKVKLKFLIFNVVFSSTAENEESELFYKSEKSLSVLKI